MKLPDQSLTPHHVFFIRTFTYVFMLILSQVRLIKGEGAKIEETHVIIRKKTHDVVKSTRSEKPLSIYNINLSKIKYHNKIGIIFCYTMTLLFRVNNNIFFLNKMTISTGRKVEFYPFMIKKYKYLANSSSFLSFNFFCICNSLIFSASLADCIPAEDNKDINNHILLNNQDIYNCKPTEWT